MSIVERLRGIYRIPITDGLGPAGGDEPDNPSESVRAFAVSPIQREAADLIEQQAARIKELEAELEVRKSTNAGWNAYYALRKRIDEAPVVAWLCEWDNWQQYHDESDPLPNDNEWDDKPNKIIPLISKEDLQK